MATRMFEHIRFLKGSQHLNYQCHTIIHSGGQQPAIINNLDEECNTSEVSMYVRKTLARLINANVKQDEADCQCRGLRMYVMAS